MFKKVFNVGKRKRIETWNKFELPDLFDDLNEADTALSKLSGGHSGEFSSAEDFRAELVIECHKLKQQKTPDFELIYLWFAPTSAWDDFAGMSGTELGNRIYERAKAWQNRNQKTK